MPVKLFEGDLQDIEKEVNAWEKKSKGQVLNIALVKSVPAQPDMFEDGSEYYSAIVTLRDKVSLPESQSKESVGQGEYPGKVPICPRCSSSMVLRRRIKDGSPFFGCTRYPGCKGVINLTEDEIAILNSNAGYDDGDHKQASDQGSGKSEPEFTDLPPGYPGNGEDDPIPF